MSSCAECRHFLPTPSELVPEAGICRRYPPKVVAVRLNPAEPKALSPEDKTFDWTTLWPAVLGGWVCGEWSADPGKVN